MSKPRVPLYGVGINDADYVIAKHRQLEERLVSGRKKQQLIWICPYYQRWSSLLKRCYSKKTHKKCPTYKDCTVCEEWLTFSVFKAWMETQDWKGKQLDKDLVYRGNKLYSPTTCVFIRKEINIFLTDNKGNRGCWLIGTSFEKDTGKFKAYCNNPFTGKLENLGRFVDEKLAHLTWKKRKYELACLIADTLPAVDDRVKYLLVKRYERFKVIEDIDVICVGEDDG